MFLTYHRVEVQPLPQELHGALERLVGIPIEVVPHVLGRALNVDLAWELLHNGHVRVLLSRRYGRQVQRYADVHSACVGMKVIS